MDKPLITVIVPVYKVEAYLRRCVDSIVNQTYKNLEIILVDDGSPDNCGKICDALAKEDARIKVIHKENGGLSSARNAGLDVMNGEYVGFVDSDDWIDADMYEQLYSLLEKSKAQIAACGIQCERPNGKVSYFNVNYPRETSVEIFSKLDALKELIIAHKITNSVCDKLFCKKMFDNMRFCEGIVNEDFEMMPRCIEGAETVAYDPTPFYHYVMTNESIMRGAFKESRFTETNISRRHIDFYKENYPELCNIAVAKHIELCLNLIYESSKDNRFKAQNKELIREIKRYKLSFASQMIGIKNKIKFILFKINVNFFYLLKEVCETTQ